MFGISGFELFIIVVFIIMVFGPSKMPDIIKIAGNGIKKYRKVKSEMDQVIQDEIVDPVMKVANEPDKPDSNNQKPLLDTASKEESETSKKSNVAEEKDNG